MVHGGINEFTCKAFVINLHYNEYSATWWTEKSLFKASYIKSALKKRNVKWRYKFQIF